MLTLPSRSQSTLGSPRRLSNGSTRIECRGLTPRPGPAGRGASATRSRPRMPSPASPSASRNRDPARWRGSMERDREVSRIGRPGSRRGSSAPVCQRSDGILARARMMAPASGAGASGREPLDRHRGLGEMHRDDRGRCWWPGRAPAPSASRRRPRRGCRGRCGRRLVLPAACSGLM